MVWLNGEWKEEGSAFVASRDGAFLRGEGVFETMLALGGRVFALERHWGRLATGSRRFGLELCNGEEGKAICEQLLGRNGLVADGVRVRVRVTRSPHSFLFSAQVGAPYPEELVLLTSPFSRNEKSALVGLKAISYGENALALAEGRERGGHEVLLANTQGHWCEGAWSNIFAVEKGRLMTPPLASGCLPGVTRELVLQLARDEGLEVSEVALPIEQVGQVDELFLTSSLLGIGPVRQFEGHTLDEGPVTARLRQRLRQCEEDT